MLCQILEHPFIIFATILVIVEGGDRQWLSEGDKEDVGRGDNQDC